MLVLKPAQHSKFLPFISYNIQNISLLYELQDPQWKTEKTRLLNLPMEEKKKLHGYNKTMDISSLNTWLTSRSNKTGIRAEDYIKRDDEFAKMKLDPSLHKYTAEKVSLFKGDITLLEVDAIVNVTNSTLYPKDGVDSDIHRAAGPFLLEECKTVGGCSPGQAKITGGYNLPAKYVIHTVGARNGTPSKLEACYQKCFSLINQYNFKTIAFPCISTAKLGCLDRLSAHILLRNTRQFLEKNMHIDRIVFCTFLPIYEELMQIYFPRPEEILFFNVYF